MITEKQNKEIIDFLLSKKLPIDILAELHDHMLSQIHEYQKQDLSFEAALEKVKSTWKEDLSVKLDIYFGWNEAKIVKKITWHTLLPIYKKSFIIGLPLSVLLLWVIYAYGDNGYVWLSIIGFYLILCSIILYLYFGKYKEYFRLVKKFRKHRLSVYDMGGSIIPSLGLLPTVLNILGHWTFRNISGLTTFLFIVAIVLLVYFNIFSTAFMISLPKFKSEMDRKVKPYLQYL